MQKDVELCEMDGYREDMRHVERYWHCAEPEVSHCKYCGLHLCEEHTHYHECFVM